MGFLWGLGNFQKSRETQRGKKGKGSRGAEAEASPGKRTRIRGSDLGERRGEGKGGVGFNKHFREEEWKIR